MGRIERRTVVIDYTPRSVFLPYHERRERWSAIVAHRRCGKTVACVNDLIRAAVMGDKPDGRYAYIAPLFTQAKDVAWNYLKHYARPLLDTAPNESELRVDLITGARIRLYGADNPDRLRGIYLDGVVLDEYADMHPAVWGEVIRPALSDRQGWATFIGTPKGKNEFWKTWERARKDDAWQAIMLRASETGILPAEELEDARKAMTPEQFEQEYECSFEAAIIGAYYAADLATATKEGRIASVPWERGAQVTTAWDLGVGDSTAIWFCQQVGKEVRLIDFYEASGVGLDHYAKVLRDKPYTYGEHLLPHDVEHKEMSTGRTRKETLEGLGFTVTVVPKLGVDEGINAVRLLLPRIWFDEAKCATGIEALRQYRTEYDDRMKVFRPKPLHDWTSHAADALRYLAVGLQPVAAYKMPKGPIFYRGGV